MVLGGGVDIWTDEMLQLVGKHLFGLFLGVRDQSITLYFGPVQVCIGFDTSLGSYLVDGILMLIHPGTFTSERAVVW